MKKTTNTPIDKPVFVFIAERTDIAFSQAAALIRDGYSFDPTSPPVTFSFGRSAIDLVLSSAPAAAKTSLARTLHYAQEELEWESAEFEMLEAEQALAAIVA